jgi:hypothetical protein
MTDRSLRLRASVAAAGVARPSAGFTADRRYADLFGSLSAIDSFGLETASIGDASAVSAQQCAQSFIISALRAVVAIETVSAGALVENVNAFLCHPNCWLRSTNFAGDRPTRAGAYIRVVVARERTGLAASAPPLVRSSADELAAALVESVPVASLRGVSAATAEALSSAGLHTAADLLEANPTEIAALVGDSLAISEVNNAFARSEELPIRAADAAHAAVAGLDRAGSLTPEALRTPKVRSLLERSLLSSTLVSGDTGVLTGEGVKASLLRWSGEFVAPPPSVVRPPRAVPITPRTRRPRGHRGPDS